MKVMIATATAGGGHLQAAIALEEAWTAMRPRDRVERLDVLDFTPRLYRKAYADGYVRFVEKVPELYAHAFRKSDDPDFMRKMMRLRRGTARLMARKFIRRLKTSRPDVVLCTHFLPLEILGSQQARPDRPAPRARLAALRRPLTVCVITDFEAHAFWMEPCVDLYCVAMEETKARLVARGIDADKIHVTGIPVSRRFRKPLPRQKIRRRLGLKNDLPVLLVLGGGMGMGPLVETMAELDTAKAAFQIIGVTGRNEALRRKLEARRYSHPAKIVGFASNMQELMAAADVIVTKPGGLTTSEALALGRPLLIVNPLPGQEAANSDFLLERGAAVKVNRLEDLRFRIDQLLKHGRLTPLARAAKRLGRPEAARRVCQAARAAAKRRASPFGRAAAVSLLMLLALTPLRAECPVKADEAMLLFPTAVPVPEAGKPGRAEVHGWMFEPEADSRVRALMLKSVMKSLGIPDLSEESELFKKRMAYFLVDNERRRAVSCRVNGSTTSLPPSDASGHMRGEVLLTESATWPQDRISSLPVQIEGCEKNGAVAAGQLWLIPRTGVSVISDIDDTIKVSNVNDKDELMLNTFVRPYEAVPGMAPLYASWAREGAAISYLTASPWQLYPALDEFLRTAGFPAGPMAMKFFRPKSHTFLVLFQDPEKYKVPLIRDELKRYPEREFILVGDSGEKDPEVYGQIAREAGSQVRLILIRNTHPELDDQARFRRAFRGLPTSQWQIFSRPDEIKDALARKTSGVQDERKAILHYRERLQATIAFVDSKPEIFPAAPLKQGRVLSRYQKEELWSTWNGFLEYVLALDSLQASHVALPRPAETARLADLRRPGNGIDRDNFLVRYGAFIVQYRWALEFLKRLDNDPGFKTILNEPVPEVGLPRGTYDHLKNRFLNLVPASQFTAMRTVYLTLKPNEASPLGTAIHEDEAALWKMGQGHGEILTLKNGLQIIGKAGFTAWFPVQTGVSEWMGDTKVWRKDQSLIQPDQIAEMRAKLLPGDILLERREWYLSNIGLPGYWPHAALYVGSPAERRAYFGKAFEAELKKQRPKAYAASLVPYEGHAPAVLEAMSEGVVFTSLEHSAAADSLVVLRPRLPKEEKQKALLRAFHYAGRPYDFNFDFATDSTIVCSELVYKAYEPAPGMKGVHFVSETMLGRQVASPNRMAQQYADERGTPLTQMDMILFLDGNERSGRAWPAPEAAFCASWNRPKWHIWTEGKPPS